MRKAFALLLVLVRLCSAGIISAHAVINRERDQVTITASTVYGDKMAADGLNVIRNAHWDHRLHWSTEYDISAEDSYKTDFEFTVNQERGEYSGSYSSDGISFSSYVHGGMSSSHGITAESLADGMFRGYEELCLDVMSRAPAGEEYSEIIELKDYYEYYPLDIFIDLSELYSIHTTRDGTEYIGSVQGDDINEVEESIREFIKIPVREGDMLEVKVYKTDAGDVIELDVAPYYGESGDYDSGGYDSYTDYYLYTDTTDKATYFTFNSGKAIDFSYIPGGYGLYCLPFGKTIEFEGEEYPTVDHEGLANVYPLSEDTIIQDFFTNKAEDKLLLVTYEDGQIVLTVIDAATMETLQRINVAEADGDIGVYSVTDYDDILILQLAAKQIAVLDILENGEYSLNYVTDRYPEGMDELYWFTTETSWAYDGRRLAAGWDLQQADPPYDNCGYSIAVYDESGMLYFGSYESGLMSGRERQNYANLCQPTIYDSLLLEWR